MTRIFISYSRVDIDIVESRIYKLLARKYQPENVWYDDQIHGGDDWWQAILDSIAYADIFVYVLTNESVSSEYCQAEFHEAQRLQKFIVTIQVRDRTKLDGALSAIQYIDMKPTADQADAVARLFTAIDRQDVKQIRRRKPLIKTVTGQPGSIADIEPTSEDEVDTPTLQAIGFPTREKQNSNLSTGLQAAGLILATIAVIISGWQLFLSFPDSEDTPTALPTEIVEGIDTATATIVSSSGLTQTSTLDSPETIEARNTLNAQATQRQVTLNAQARLDAQTTQTILDITATAYAPIQLAIDGVNSNDEWTPYMQEFDGIEMMLVPTGCFWMGENGEGGEQCFATPFWIDKYEVSNAQFVEFLTAMGNRNNVGDAYLDTADADRKIHYDNGIWQIDRGFVNRPVVEISWYGANDYCAWRNEQLPTESQWEYAARGVDELIYPWGNDFDPDNVTYATNNSDGEISTVDSNPSGVSWVGAYNMSGNIWEWTGSLYQDYPYASDDGRESVIGNQTDVRRVLRGGSLASTYRADFRTVIRIGNSTDHTSNLNGFRCARDFTE